MGELGAIRAAQDHIGRNVTQERNRSSSASQSAALETAPSAVKPPGQPCHAWLGVSGPASPVPRVAFPSSVQISAPAASSGAAGSAVISVPHGPSRSRASAWSSAIQALTGQPLKHDHCAAPSSRGHQHMGQRRGPSSDLLDPKPQPLLPELKGRARSTKAQLTHTVRPPETEAAGYGSTQSASCTCTSSASPPLGHRGGQ